MAEADEDVRTGLRPATLRRAFSDHLQYTLGRIPALASSHDRYLAAAYAVRDRLLQRWTASADAWLERVAEARDLRVVAYLSAEFLPGPHLGNNLVCLGIHEQVEDALRAEGHPLEELLEQEEEPGLGNGGLGRLAACFLDSLATLEIPAVGYGIRYEFGIFDQAIRDGWQQEITDKWLRFGNAWEIARPELALEVKLGGRTEVWGDAAGRHRVRWLPQRVVKGIPYDTPVPGYRVDTCNTLRLWKAEACESFDFQAFNAGDYYRAVDEKVSSENLTKVLYPNDEPEQGRRLRLEQQYFFTSCALQDMIRARRRLGLPLETFHEGFAVQLNDTHPAIAVAELMRLLVDEHGFDWEPAWEITRRTFGYTNHTLLPEALETWPVELFGRVLPRHLEMVYEINRRFLDEVRRRHPGDEARVARLSLIDEGGGRRVRMANLAAVGSHAVNGVAALHTRLLATQVMRDFHELWPEKFSNKTNGVTPRRFLVLSNPGLHRLIRSRIGESWVRHLDELRRLEPLAGDPDCQAEWRAAKRQNKERLARDVLARTGVTVDPDSLFDIQVKRIHEYKRQHLNLLHVLSLYRKLEQDPGLELAPRTFVFAGKAAPGYFMAKLIIKLVNEVAAVVNRDPAVRERLRVVFLPDFNVKNAMAIYPAADLSEQISTAGKEASGTGNMKFTMNGALTIGTLDGANVEILEEVGPENFFLFGHTADEVMARKAAGYRPRDHVESDAELRAVLDWIASGAFSGGDRGLFRPLLDQLLERDDYLVLADYRSYVDRQAEVDRAFRDTARWSRMSILNTARSGRFSSDRAIQEYCDEIWRVKPLPVRAARAVAGRG
jgi:starch phosphorylase